MAPWGEQITGSHTACADAQVVLSAVPFASAVLPSHRKRVCAFCFRDARARLRESCGEPAHLLAVVVGGGRAHLVMRRARCVHSQRRAAAATTATRAAAKPTPAARPPAPRCPSIRRRRPRAGRRTHTRSPRQRRRSRAAPPVRLMHASRGICSRARRAARTSGGSRPSQQLQAHTTQSLYLRPWQIRPSARQLRPPRRPLCSRSEQCPQTAAAAAREQRRGRSR